MNAPLPNFTAIVRATPLEQLPELSAALAEASARTIARIAEEAGRNRKATQDHTTRWIDTFRAAQIAGFFDHGIDRRDPKNQKKVRVGRMRIAQWAKNQAWASHPSRRKVLIDLDAFQAWLNVRRSA